MLTRSGMKAFPTLAQPPLSPPAWLFPVAWTILYILMGIASYLVWTSVRRQKNALYVYGVQLFLNFFWPIIFFGFQHYLTAFLWLLLLWVAILGTLILFYRTDKKAGWLLVPYLIWVAFAGYLNLGVYLLNR